MAEEPRRVALAGEDAAHFLLLCTLSDAALRASAAAGDVNLDATRTLLPDPDTGRPWWRVSGATQRFKALHAAPGRPLHRSRRLGAEPEGHARELLDLVALVEGLEDAPAALLVMLDEDGVKDRARAVTRALEHLDARDRRRIQTVIIALCSPVAEAWLVGLVGLSPEHRRRGPALKREIGFDPFTKPHELGCDRREPHCAKRVLTAVLDPDITGLRRVPAATPSFEETERLISGLELDLDRLRLLDACGLRAFIDQLRNRYVPVILRTEL